uniref:Uncharacterized protein n=1 Tax=Globisporangium ultimum (strain ATCC 200006 / CBS 805.95 / DAOM BR144) TaxID=431595 RepID=K3WC48_GLOUD
MVLPMRHLLARAIAAPHTRGSWHYQHLRVHCRSSSSTSAKALTTKFDVSAQQLSASGQSYRVVFGANAAADHLGAIARASGIRKMLVVRDKDAGAASRTQYVEFLLLQAGIPCFQYTLKRDCPTLEGINDGYATAQRVGANGVLAFGGGNTMDMTRAIALMMTNGGDAASYVKDGGANDCEPAAPHIILPTINGSGAEISTQVLVLDEDAEAKQLLVESPITAEAVIIDPMLSLSVPLKPTVQGALTALGQCIESFLSGCEDQATEMLALQGIEVIASAFAQPLVQGKMNLKNVGMRERFALGSLFSGIAANSSGYGCAHSIAVAMGGISDLPHAQVATGFLPFVFDKYAQLADENEGDEFFDALRAKLESVNDRLTAASGFQGASVSAWIRYVSTRFDLPNTSTLELDEGLVKGIVERSVQRQDETIAHREEGPILESDDIRAIVEAAIVVASEQTKND